MTSSYSKWLGPRVAALALAAGLGMASGATAQTPGSKPSTVTFALEQDHFFTSQGAKLHGKLFAPAAKGKFPAIVYVTGGGDYSLMVDAYARNTAKAFTDAGIAVFMFDKRGQGKSEGSYPDAENPERTADAIAAYDTMAKLPQVDPSRLGVWALSQAGWFVPPVMSARPDADFLILLSPAGESHMEFFQTVTRRQLTKAGLSGNDLVEAADLWLAISLYYGTAEKYEATRAALADAQAKPWYATAQTVGSWKGLPATPSDLMTPDQLRADWIAKPKEYDFLRAPDHRRNYSADYASIRQPVLLIFGGGDTLIDPAESEKMFAEAWKGRRDASIVRFNGAGHGIQRPGMGEDPMPEYLDMATMWAKRHFDGSAAKL